jgi:hypothetical protein
LGDERLDLSYLLAVVAARIKGNRRSTEPLHLVDLALISSQVPVVIRSDHRDPDLLAL